MRFEDALKVENAVDLSVMHRFIPTLSIQILIENAIKHNIVSSARPLHIRLENEGDRYLVVGNALQPKTSMEETTKMGLQNIKDRYALLGKDTPLFIRSAERYCVKLPLLT